MTIVDHSFISSRAVAASKVRTLAGGSSTVQETRASSSAADRGNKRTNYHLFPASSNRVTEWSGGTTTELFVTGGSFAARNFALRLSRARIAVEESTFTGLPGFLRHLTLLWSSSAVQPRADEIAGRRPGATSSFQMRIRGRHGDAFFGLEPWESVEFSGADVVASRGLAEDFNVIYDPGRLAGGRVRVDVLELLNEGEKIELPLDDDRLSNLHSQAFIYFPGGVVRPPAGSDESCAAAASASRASCSSSARTSKVGAATTTVAVACKSAGVLADAVLHPGDSVLVDRGAEAVTLQLRSQNGADLPVRLLQVSFSVLPGTGSKM
ncbi:unnamed protein product [Amoebophrya sp. A120]|nr:unnamed protein product [Amoebophrya sp. A120]|eukprot:GSA120T00008345001.1